MTKLSVLMMMTAISFINCNIASAEPIKFPDELMVNGHPIDPFCFDVQEYPEEGIDVNQCRYEGIKIKGDDTPRLNDDGVVRFDYSFEDDQIGEPFVEYQFLGTVDKGQVISVTSSGGGTGVFSSVQIVQRKDNKIYYRDRITGGDRCNGGIVNTWVENKKIKTESWVTPYDIAVLKDTVAGKESPLQAYEYLENCASCCAGTVTAIDHKIITLKLNDEPYGQSGNDNAEPEGVCFNKLYANKLNNQQVEMNLDQAIAFSNQIQTECKK